MAPSQNDPDVKVRALGERWYIGDRRRLAETLGACPDVAFAYLAEVEVEGQQGGGPVVLVWLRPAALRSLRGALNLVSESVAQVIPGDAYVDVVIANSSPELVGLAERADTLLVEADPEERHRTLSALAEESVGEPEVRDARARWWWPF